MNDEMNRCIYSGRLPSLNAYISELNNNRYKANHFKQSLEDGLVWAMRTSKTMRPVDKPCIVKIIYHEPDRRRDVDNIYSANKFILDALRKARIIKNDSQKYVRDVKDSYIVDGQSRVDIIIDEMEDE